MAERGPLREAGRPRRVLDVDRVVSRQAGRRLGEAGPIGVRPGQSLPFRRPDDRDRPQLGAARSHLGDHGFVVGRLELRRGHQVPDARLVQHELELVGPVRAGPRGRRRGPRGPVPGPPCSEGSPRWCHPAAELPTGPRCRRGAHPRRPIRSHVLPPSWPPPRLGTMRLDMLAYFEARRLRSGRRRVPDPARRACMSRRWRELHAADTMGHAA